jgi:hypothetical protein
VPVNNNSSSSSSSSSSRAETESRMSAMRKFIEHEGAADAGPVGTGTVGGGDRAADNGYQW